MKTKQPNQIMFRAPPEFFERMSKVAAQQQKPGLAITTTDVLRMAAFRGLELLEAEGKKGKRP